MKIASRRTQGTGGDRTIMMKRKKIKRKSSRIGKQLESNHQRRGTKPRKPRKGSSKGKEFGASESIKRWRGDVWRERGGLRENANARRGRKFVLILKKSLNSRSGARKIEEQGNEKEICE